jgi:diacylglycerol kinase (ATP)
MKPTARGFSHLLLATRYSMQGLRSAWRHEESFRQEALIALLGLPLALLLARDTVDFLLLALPLLLLMLAELGNSAIEAIVDRMEEGYDELLGRAKDLGSAMVFMAIMMVGLSWSTVLLSVFYFRP